MRGFPCRLRELHAQTPAAATPAFLTSFFFFLHLRRPTHQRQYAGGTNFSVAALLVRGERRYGDLDARQPAGLYGPTGTFRPSLLNLQDAC